MRKDELQNAVSYWWGVSITQVQNWRSRLGVERRTPGTARLLAENAKAMPAEVREAIAERRRGKPQPAHVRAMLLEHAKLPKSPKWISQATQWLADARERARGDPRRQAESPENIQTPMKSMS